MHIDLRSSRSALADRLYRLSQVAAYREQSVRVRPFFGEGPEVLDAELLREDGHLKRGLVNLLRLIGACEIRRGLKKHRNDRQSAHARAANRGPMVCQPTASVLGTRTQSVHLASRANGQQEGKPGGLGPVLRPSCRSLDQAFSPPSTNEKSLRSSGEIMPSWIRCLKLINLFQ
jgi:hypothetical protein